MNKQLYDNPRQTMGLKYIKLPDSPLKMSRPDVQNYLEGQSWALVIRSLLMYELARIRAADQAEPRTLRSLWYTLIKPALEKLGALEESYYSANRVKNPTDVGKIPDWDGLTSKYLAQMVEKGITSYEELAIIDGSRQRRAPQGVEISINDVSLVGAHYPNIILFTEKDTIYNVVEGVGAIYGVSVLSGGGMPSYAATENHIKDIVRHENFETGSKILILTLTDYDPAGYKISQAVIEQVRKVVSTIYETGGVAYQRLGLEPEQLTQEELEQNTYTPAKAGLQKWVRETGGVNGEPLGLELDALPIRRIRELFVEGLQLVIKNEADYHKDMAMALVELLIYEAIEPQIEALKKNLRRAIDADGIIDGLHCPADTMATFARAGFSYVNPLEYDQYIFNAASRIREKIKEACNE